MKQTKNEIHNDSYGSILRIPSFCVLLVGRLISGAGQILFSMATMWYILQLTESALAAALIPMLPYFIYAFLGIPLATISDRLPKKQLLIWTDILRACVACILALLFMSGQMVPWHIYAANLLIAILGFLFNPATQTVIPAILPNPSKQLAPANALLNSSSKTIELLGYAIGGILVAFISVQSILFIYALTFLVSSLSIVFIHIPVTKVVKQKGISGFMRDSIQGITFLFSRKILACCIIFGAIINFAGAPLHIFTPIFANMVLHAGPQGYGLLQSAFAAGSIAGSLLSGKYAKRLSLARWFLISYLISGASLLLMPMFPNLYIAIACSFLLMLGLALVNVPLVTSILLSTPEEKRGRVMNSMGVLMSGISNPLGLLLGGWFIETYNPSWVYMGIGVFVVIMGLTSLFVRPFREEQGTHSRTQKASISSEV
ncbi:MFS transporter [Paenibacillus xylanilyticus]|uniref:MFS transporter n=1 Tax=Paenibacillus xylanilyticus TaxID=248903 RepID=A0A7Y6EUW3_9BACL|nr:MFS transporter [Paenibacillus xylanilyticus]NUU76046.1 MFS transporter [Paenibacillus xylanilyticus]